MELIGLPFFVLTLGYILGEIPFGLILTRLFKAGDLRQIGSGNIGATNVLRTGRKGLAAATLILDMLKGYLAVWIAAQFVSDFQIWAAVGAVLGHLYPAWLRFKGGKGVATYAGVMFGLFWPGGAVYVAVWLAALAIFRISSMAGMLAVVSAPLAALYFGFIAHIPPLAALSLLVIWKHRDNILRLRMGTEPRVGANAK